MNTREHAVKVSLNSEELARIDGARGRTERAVYLRRLLYEPPDVSEVASREEALAILSRLARGGRTPPRSRSSALFAITRGAPTLTTSFRGCSTTNDRGNQGGASKILSVAHRRPPPVAPCEKTQNSAR